MSNSGIKFIRHHLANIISSVTKLTTYSSLGNAAGSGLNCETDHNHTACGRCRLFMMHRKNVILHVKK